MKTYIYPQNLRASAQLWVWSIKDFAIICLAVLLSMLIIVKTYILPPLAVTACYAFLTIRADDRTIMDFIKYAARHFITTQQYFEWRL